jgi:hypothetical protein
MNEIYTDTSLIDAIRYRAYEISDEQKTEQGKRKRGLEIGILERFTDYTECLIKYTEPPNAFDRIVITPLFNLEDRTPLDAIEPITPFVLDLDRIQAIETLNHVIIRGNSTTERMHVKVHFTLWADADGVTREPTLTSAIVMEFQHCVFIEGIKLTDRRHAFIEFYNCAIHKRLYHYEETEPKRTLDVVLKLDSCDLHNIQSLRIKRLTSFALLNSTFTYSEPYTIDPYINVRDCESVFFHNITVTPFITPLMFYDNPLVSIENLRGIHIKESEPLATTVSIINSSKMVSLSGVYSNGIAIDSSHNVAIASLRIAKDIVSNAPVAIQISRCTGKVAIAQVDIGEDSVKTGIMIGSCAAAISIVSSKFYGITTGISINGCSNGAAIADCTITKCTKACVFKTIDGQTLIGESLFDNNEVSLTAVQLQECYLTGTTIKNSGKHATVPSSSKADVELRQVGILNISENSSFESIALSIIEAYVIFWYNSTISHCYCLFAMSKQITIENCLFELMGNSKGNFAFIFQEIGGFSCDETVFQDETPLFKDIGDFVISDSTFTNGVMLENCGSNQSLIDGATIGYFEDPKRYTAGIICKDCVWVRIKGTMFNNDKESEGIRLENCELCTIEENQLSAARIRYTVIQNSTGIMALNHIIIDTRDRPFDRPIVSSSSMFQEVLYFINNTVYYQKYHKTLPYSTIEQVFKQYGNIVSYVDFNEEWVQPYINKLEAMLIRFYRGEIA